MEGFARDQNEIRFTYDFVKNLISDTEMIDIDILGENNVLQGDKDDEEQIIMDEIPFDIEGLRADFKDYDQFLEGLMGVLNEIEHEIFEK